MFVRRVYQYFISKAEWPPEHDLRRQLVQNRERDVFAAGTELPDWFVLFHADGQNGVALRVAAIWDALGETRELQDFVSLLRLAAARYEQPGVPPILRDDELAAVGLSRDRLSYIDALFESNHFVSGPSGTAGKYSYAVHSGIEPYLDAGTIPEFLEILWREKYSSSLVGRANPPRESEPDRDRRGVFVVHGRNTQAAAAMSDLLHAFGLDPQFFRDSLKLTGKATPSIPEVLDVALNRCYACVVVMTPDDVAQLRIEHIRSSDPDHERKPMGQARPNVLFEAGMSWARHGAARTVIVELGSLRPLTDLSGLHTVHFDDSPSSRRELGSKLETAGCPVNWSERDWLRAGNFDEVLAAIKAEPESVARADDTTAEAVTELSIRSIGNLATEDCARWLHLEVATSTAMIARSARVSVVPPGRTQAEDWQWVGGLSTVDVRTQGVRIPLVIGVLREPCSLALGWPLATGRWYLTPTAQSGVGRDVGAFAPKARFQFQVIVSWDDGGVERRVLETFEVRLGRSMDSEPILIRAGDRPTLENQMPILASLRNRGVELRNQGMSLGTVRFFLMWRIVVQGWTEETREAIAAVSVKDANFWSTLDTYVPEAFPAVMPVTDEHLLELRVLHEHIQRLARFMREGAL